MSAKRARAGECIVYMSCARNGRGHIKRPHNNAQVTSVYEVVYTDQCQRRIEGEGPAGRTVGEVDECAGNDEVAASTRMWAAHQLQR